MSGWSKQALAGTRRRRQVMVAGVASAAMVVSLPALSAVSSAASQGGPAGAPKGAPAMKAGGSMTVLEVAGSAGNWPAGLDPKTAATADSNHDIFNSIYGDLFELSPSGKTIPDLATGYTFLDGGKTVKISLRPGVKFSDGTPFNAAAVIFNWKRDFKEDLGSTPAGWPLAKVPFTAPNSETVEIHLTAPYSPIINSMHVKNVNWIASPTAVKKMSAKEFATKPVGAGPFTVVSDTYSSEIILKKNPLYWQKGLPLLDKLTFKSVSSDEGALEAMQSGQAQAYLGMTTAKLVPAFKGAGLTVTSPPTGAVQDIQMNTKIPPFNNIKAREALYYATNAPLLDQKLFGDLAKPVEGFTAPGGLFYDSPKVPGYRAYNLAKAKSLVQQLGGLSFTLLGVQSSNTTTLDEGLQTEWQEAGMKVTLQMPADITTLVQDYISGKWQAANSGDGAWDPAVGIAQTSRFLSNAEFSGVHDPKLDALLNKASSVLTYSARNKAYQAVAKYESDKAYTVQLWPSSMWDIASKGIYGPGLTTKAPYILIAPEVWWQYTGYAQS